MEQRELQSRVEEVRRMLTEMGAEELLELATVEAVQREVEERGVRVGEVLLDLVLEGEELAG